MRIEDGRSSQDDRRGMSRMLGRVLSIIRTVDDTVNRSTFGRVFRLKECGHVSSLPNRATGIVLLAGVDGLTSLANGNPRCQLLDRAACRPDNFCNDGLHYRRQCQNPFGNPVL
jgi:hypothetical protein